jgi:hypothetical protein
MVLSNAERQKRYRDRLKAEAREKYEMSVMRKQIAELEQRLNETRRAVNLPEIQLPKVAKGREPV